MLINVRRLIILLNMMMTTISKIICRSGSNRCLWWSAKVCNVLMYVTYNFFYRSKIICLLVTERTTIWLVYLFCNLYMDKCEMITFVDGSRLCVLHLFVVMAKIPNEKSLLKVLGVHRFGKITYFSDIIFAQGSRSGAAAQMSMQNISCKYI